MDNVKAQVGVEEEENDFEERNREECEEMSLMDMCSWGEFN